MLVNILGGNFVALGTPKQKIPVVETGNIQPLLKVMAPNFESGKRRPSSGLIQMKMYFIIIVQIFLI